MARFDWYEYTTHRQDADHVVQAISRANPMAEVRPDRAMHGYLHGAAVVNGPDTIATVWWGGNPGVHVKASGKHSPPIAELGRAIDDRHLCTRVDVCEDWDEPGFFDTITRRALDWAKENGIAINQQGDWERGQARTLYLGSFKSEIQLRIYEKGFQMGIDAGHSPNWVRVECQVKLKKREARERMASLAPGRFWSIGWLKEAMAAILAWDHLPDSDISRRHDLSNADKARAALIRQYGSHLEQWAADVGGWAYLGGALASLKAEIQERKQVARAMLDASRLSRERAAILQSPL